jgi:hypothetical protein
VVRSHKVVRFTAGQENAERIAERSTSVWILVFSPPRERPIAWSSPAAGL